MWIAACYQASLVYSGEANKAFIHLFSLVMDYLDAIYLVIEWTFNVFEVQPIQEI